jgi:hypothetical protein
MQHTLLTSNEFALEECACFKPNSRLWQDETGNLLLGSFTAARLGTLLDSGFVPAAMGVLRPFDAPAMDSVRNLGGTDYTGSTGNLRGNPFGFYNMPAMAGIGGIMTAYQRPASLEIPIRNYNNGNTIGNFNNLNYGSHSRPGGLPPLPIASAPPGRASADPGGGPTAS